MPRHVVVPRGFVLMFALVAALAVPISAFAADHASPVASPVGISSYAHPKWLVDGDQLRSMLADDPVVKVVALTEPADFEAGHVPGAAQIDWPTLEIVETGDQQVDTWRGEVEQLLTELGIANSDTVVVYDGGTLYAARLWWILDQLGHEDKRILNGGLGAWEAAGGEIETGPSTVQPAPAPYAGTPDESAIAKLAEVQAALDDPDVVLVDARSPGEYADGHLPGAVNIEFTRNADESGTWLSADELRAMYAEAGVTPGKTIFPYCTTGVRSAVTYFTLRLLGYEDVSLFTGSFKEWSSHPDLPVTTGN